MKKSKIAYELLQQREVAFSLEFMADDGEWYSTGWSNETGLVGNYPDEIDSCEVEYLVAHCAECEIRNIVIK